MKKIMCFTTFAGITIIPVLIVCLSACGPKKITRQFDKTNFATVTIEGSGLYGAINSTTGEELLPQKFSAIGYYYSGYFSAQDDSGISLYDTLKNQVIPPKEQISAKDGYFEFSTAKTSKGSGTKGIYLIKTGKTISGVFDTMEVDKAGNVVITATVGGEKLYGAYSPQSELIIPLEYPYFIFDGENYNVAKNKNPKFPMVDKKGKINWRQAEAFVLDKEGKQVKKLTAAQAKKIFEAK